MKRSEINRLMLDAIDFFNENKFYLPKFAYWKIGDWKKKGEEVKEIIDCQLGWDISDFGKGIFHEFGLILFTIRNGDLKTLTKNYCEKVMIVNEGQTTPMHYHFKKQEDIINRAGGSLNVQVYNKTEDDQLADTPVSVVIDGIKKTVKAGGVICLTPGESIFLPSYIYHTFWAKKGTRKVLIGEVSSVNDDRFDNYFLKNVGRFAEIEEDEEPLYLLCSDYEKYLNILKNK